MKRILPLIIVAFFCLKANSQNAFQKMYWYGMQDILFSAAQTSDKGFIMSGLDNGLPPYGMIVKTDSVGVVQWANAYGLFNFPELYCVRQTSDGGYIATGSYNSRCLLIKINSNGTTAWDYTYGGSGSWGNMVKQTSDGGYIVTGATESFGSKDSADVYLLKVDGSGNLTWDKAFRFSTVDDDIGNAVEIAPDGYIVAGETEQINGTDTLPDIFLLKTDLSGNLLWAKTWGDNNQYDVGYDVKRTSDGGYILSGETSKTASGLDGGDMFLIKTDASGNLSWSSAYHMGMEDMGMRVVQTNNGYGVMGTTFSLFGGNGGLWMEAFLVKTNSTGTVTNSRIYNYPGATTLIYDGQMASDSGFVLGGWTGMGVANFYLNKTNKNLVTSCNEYNATVTTRAFSPATESPVVTTNSTTARVNDNITRSSVTITSSTICQLLPLVANAGSDKSICSGSSVSIGASPTATGGIQPYTYAWSPSSGLSATNVANPNANPVANTTYTVTVTDNTGATATDAVVVTVNPVPTANAGSNVSICNGNSTTLNATGGGTYSWSPATGLSATNISNPVANPSTTTTYIVTVTNAFSCSATDDVVVTVNSLPVANAGLDVGICIGSSTQLTASGGTSYAWSPSTGLSAININNPIANPLTTTTYIVTVTNAAGCTATDNVQVTVNSLPTASAGSASSICLGQSTTLNASGGVSYLWSPGTGLSATNVSNPIASPTTTTTYTVTVTNAATCTASASVTVTVNSVTASISATQNPICLGQYTTLTAGGGSIYSWNSGQVTSNISVNPAVTTSYTVTVSDVNGCSDSEDIIVTVYSAPPANAGTDVAICIGSPTSLSATGGNTYAWSPGTGLSATNIANPIANPAVTTTYTVTVSDAAGCSATDNVIVTVNPLPLADAGANTTICIGNSTVLSGSGGINYSWSPGASLNNSGISNPTASPLVSTTYTVTVTDINGCVQTDAVLITVNNPIANAGNNVSICLGSSTTLSASGGTTYLWSPSTGLNSATVANPVANPTSTTTYTVVVSDAAGCSASDDVVVTVLPLPVANAGNDDTICNGQSAQLMALGGNSYSWLPTSSLNNPLIANPVASPSVSTTYTVVVTDANGCSSSDNVVLVVNATPVANAGLDQSICLGESTTLTAIGGTIYSWNTGDNSATVSVTPSITTLYVVTVSYANGCSSSDAVTVAINPVPTIDMFSDPQCCWFYQGQLVTFTALPANYNSYEFFVNNQLVQTGPSNTYITNALINGQVVSVLGENAGCLSLLDSMVISIHPIPNAFTPQNNDGINDVFVKGMPLQIINRWGEELYNGTEGWDGKYNGKYVSPGTYYYVITLIDPKNQETKINGTVIIIAE